VRVRSPRKFGALWSPIFLPLLFIGAALSIPYGLGRTAYWRLKERRFARQMASLSRTISFEELASRVESGQGTIIHEWYSVLKGPIRHWWVVDDVLSISPRPFVDRLHMIRRRYKPLVEWCFREYTSPQQGRALFFVVGKAQKEAYPALLEKARFVDVPTLSKQDW